MPYPNEHSARLRDPDDFNPKTFRRVSGGTIYGKIKVPKTIDIIWGKLKGKDKPKDNPIPQALRFPTKNWTVAKAKKWLKDNNVTYEKFEPAKKEKKQSQGEAPAKAFRLIGGIFELGDNGDGAKSAPVKLLARSAKPIDHWFWGRIVHDMAGMKLHKEKLPIDYIHDANQIIGYLNHFKVSKKDGLTCKGALVPYGENDRATEIIHKSKAGVPYEASINFGGDGIKIEQVPEKVMAKVNGYELEGPAVIVREWPLRGVAICPYGADQNTATEALAESSEKINFEFVGSRDMDEEKQDETTEIKPDEKPDESAEDKPVETPAEETPEAEGESVETEKPETETEPAEAPADNGGGHQKPVEAGQDKNAFQALVAEFGKEFAADCLLEGLSPEDARAKFAAKLKTENAELKKRLMALGQTGEETPADFDEAQEPAETEKAQQEYAKRKERFTQNIGPGLGAFAAGLQMPKRQFAKKKQ